MKVLVVDDDPELLPLIAYALRQAGYLALEATSGEAALELVEREAPDLLVLDANLPGCDGFEVCRKLREAEVDLPILMLTVRSEEDSQVRALDLGADDYMTKPFSPRTLLARVRALLRRAGSESEGRIALGDLELDPELQAMRLPGRAPQRLTALEFRLLQLLAAQAGRTVSADQILRHVWGARDYSDKQHLKQLVHRLRQKLEADPSRPRRLLTDAGSGYRLALERDPSAEAPLPDAASPRAPSAPPHESSRSADGAEGSGRA